MSLESIIQENTAAMKELIAVIKAGQKTIPVALAENTLVPPTTETSAVPIEAPSRARAVTALNEALALKGQDAVKAILLRFGKTRVSEFEPAELGDLIQALEA